MSLSVSALMPPMKRVVMLLSSGGSGTLNSFILLAIFYAKGSLTPLYRSLILSSSLPCPFAMAAMSSSVMLSCR